MKKQIAAFVAAQGLQTAYSGNLRKMFIIGKGCRRVKDMVKQEFGELPFTLVDQPTKAN